VKEGLVVSIRAPAGMHEDLRIEPDKGRFEKPLAILINTETASGAEMLAACLQDHKRGTIIGERSQGKGGVQNIEFDAVGNLQLTRALFLRPNGKSWQGWQAGEGGVTPDAGFEVRLTRR